MKAFLKTWTGPVLVLVSLAIVLILGFSGGELPGALTAMRTSAPGFLFLSVLCSLGAVLMDAVSVRSALKSSGYDVRLRDSLTASVKGSFYSSITPGAAGGQPMQVHHLMAHGIPVGAGTSAVMQHFICEHVMLTVLTLALGIPFLGFALSNIGTSWPILLIGILYNTVMVLSVLFLCFSRKAVRFLVEKGVSIAEKLRLTKDAQTLRTNWLHTADTFHESMMNMKEHPSELLRQLLFGTVKLLLMMSTLFFVCMSLGMAGGTYGQILTMALCQHISAAYMPMPGASGAQEGVFGLYFGALLPGSTCLAGMLIWRFVTYYLGLIAGAAVCLAERKEAFSATALHTKVMEEASALRREMKTALPEKKVRLQARLRALESRLPQPENHAEYAGGH